ncbi:MAG: GNAT family N-acetyltransferase [SAR324 cluster bacterium]|uniref:GNAT family N-acetyltransferase n=1 Tax=SAR324 cluster bacterium TaxID=2024889 RepID=A0A7X9FUA7_9DELT|nr:GNAT family N-acetyltransferase [SAR324 cluster bacterium]
MDPSFSVELTPQLGLSAHEVRESNFNEAMKTAEAIFGESDSQGICNTYKRMLSGDLIYAFPVEGGTQWIKLVRYMLYKKDEQCVGISGLYASASSEEALERASGTLWLGWFGVVPELRGRREGGKSAAEEIIEHTESLAIRAGAETLKVYTDADNSRAIAFYKKNGFEEIPGEKVQYKDKDGNCYEEVVLQKDLSQSSMQMGMCVDMGDPFSGARLSKPPFRDLHEQTPGLGFEVRSITHKNLEEAITLVSEVFEDEEEHVLVCNTYRRLASENLINPALWEQVQEWHRLVDYVLYSKDGKGVGVSGLYVTGKSREEAELEYDTVWLGWFGVVPEMRGQGAAKEIIAHTEELARRMGANRIKVYVDDDNYPALRFYKKSGFNPLPDEDYDFIDDSGNRWRQLVLCKSLI